MKIMYEINYTYGVDGVFSHITLDKVKVVPEDDFSDTGNVVVTNKQGHRSYSRIDRFFETEEAAWEAANKQLTDYLNYCESQITTLQRQIQAIKKQKAQIEERLSPVV